MKEFLKKWAPFFVLIVTISGQMLTIMAMLMSIQGRLSALEATVQMRMSDSKTGGTVDRVALVELKYGHPRQ